MHHFILMNLFESLIMISIFFFSWIGIYKGSLLKPTQDWLAVRNGQFITFSNHINWKNCITKFFREITHTESTNWQLSPIMTLSYMIQFLMETFLPIWQFAPIIAWWRVDFSPTKTFFPSKTSSSRTLPLANLTSELNISKKKKN